MGQRDCLKSPRSNRGAFSIRQNVQHERLTTSSSVGGVNYEDKAEFLQGQCGDARPVWKFRVSLCIKDTNRGGQNRTEETKL